MNIQAHGTQWVTVAVSLLLGIGLLTGTANADVKTVKVDCVKGQTIAKALEREDERKPLIVIVQGTCNENVVMTRDDVTLQGDAAAGGAVVGVDPAQATVQIDGARRVVIDNLTVSGGSDGILVTRGATSDLRNCAVQGNGRIGVVVSYGATATVDNCLIQNNGGGGLAAANSASLALTNSTVQGNTGFGVVGARNANVRVGQDLAGSAALGPVVIRGNTGNGLVVTENSAGILVGSTVENNGGTGVWVGRGSNASIGIGSLSAVGPNTIRGNAGNGIDVHQSSQALIHGNLIETHSGSGVRVEGSAATITANTIRGGRFGVGVWNGGNAHIGLTDAGTSAGNFIEQNTLDGVQLTAGSSAWLYGNTIQNNGVTTGRWGILAFENSVVRMAGLNTVRSNGGGAAGGGVLVGDSSTLNSSRGDFAITPNNDDISNNSGSAGILAVDNSSVDLRDGTTVTNNSGQGIFLLHGSRLRMQQTTVSGNTGNAIQLTYASSARFLSPASTIVGSIVCDDGESSITGISLPSGCTGF